MNKFSLILRIFLLALLPASSGAICAAKTTASPAAPVASASPAACQPDSALLIEISQLKSEVSRLNTKVENLNAEIDRKNRRLAPLDSIEKRALMIMNLCENVDTIPLADVDVYELTQNLDDAMQDESIIRIFAPRSFVSLRNSYGKAKEFAQMAATYQQCRNSLARPTNEGELKKIDNDLAKLSRQKLTRTQQSEVADLRKKVSGLPGAKRCVEEIITTIGDWTVIPDADTAKEALDELVRPALRDYLSGTGMEEAREDARPELLFPQELTAPADVLNEITDTLIHYKASRLNSSTALAKWLSSLRARL